MMWRVGSIRRREVCEQMRLWGWFFEDRGVLCRIMGDFQKAHFVVEARIGRITCE